MAAGVLRGSGERMSICMKKIDWKQYRHVVIVCVLMVALVLGVWLLNQVPAAANPPAETNAAEEQTADLFTLKTADYQAAFESLVKDNLGEEVTWSEMNVEGIEEPMLAGSLLGNPCLVLSGDYTTSIMVGMTVDMADTSTSASAFQLASIVSGAAALQASGMELDAALELMNQGFVTLMDATTQAGMPLTLNIGGMNATATLQGDEESGMTLLLYLTFGIPDAAAAEEAPADAQ